MSEKEMSSVISVPSATIDIPKEVVPLPSKGKVYPPDSPLHTSEIEIYHFTARGEDCLTSRNLLKRGVVLDKLIQMAIVNRTIKVEDMLLGDKNAIMIAYRITGYGSQYKTEAECPGCEKKIQKIFDLSKMPVIPLGVDPVMEGENRFEFILPISGKKVHFKLLTSKEDREIASIIEAEKKISEIESNITTRLFMSILQIDDVTGRDAIKKIVQTLPAGDSLELRNYIKDIEPGVEMYDTLECPYCGEANEVLCPIGIEFFWPSFGRRRKRKNML